MDYLWLKVLHIVAVLTWVGGMLVIAFANAAISEVGESQESVTRVAFLRSGRRWDRRVTTPAMVLVWVIGLTLALVGHWFPQPWLLVKMTLVLVLSALHGSLSGRLWRSTQGVQMVGTSNARFATPAILATVFMVVALVVIKPI